MGETTKSLQKLIKSNRPNVGGTSNKGEIHAPYDKLVQIFGRPSTGGDKTDAEWSVEFIDGTVATVYDYKTGVNYLGLKGIPAEKQTRWQTGGFNKKAWAWVNAIVRADHDAKRTLLIMLMENQE